MLVFSKYVLFQVYGFTPKHRKIFLDLIMRFGLPPMDQNLSDSVFFVRELRLKPEKHLRAYASLFFNHLCEPGDPNSTTFEDGVPKEGLNVSQVLTRVGMISLIKRKVYEFQHKHGLVSLRLPKKPSAQSILVGPVNSDPVNEANPAESLPSTSNEEKVEENPIDNVSDKQLNVNDNKNVDEQTTEEPMETVDSKQVEEESSAVVEKGSDEAIVEDSEKKEKNPEDADEPAERQDNAENVGDAGDNQEEDTNKLDEPEDVEEDCNTVKDFEFNIQDGGITELHTLWAYEEQELKPKREHEIWNRRHDYWLLCGIVKHGYERWLDIVQDEDLSFLVQPFRNTSLQREKFMERRLRLLEQALVFEEHIRRNGHLESVPKYIPKTIKSQKVDGEENGKANGNDEEDKDDESEDSEKDEIAEADDKENVEAKLVLNPVIQRGANQMEDLLVDMKSDCARIPQTVQRIPSIANRLQLVNRNQQGPTGFNRM